MAGGRVIVKDLAAQDQVTAKISEAFTDARLVDRRKLPVVGYHAVHFVIRVKAQSYELQIRTEAQQRWAQLSEKFADLVGFEIKYGGGPETLSKLLTSTGELIYLIEQLRVTGSRLLEFDEAARMLPNFETGIDRNQLAADLSEADADLEQSFSDLEEVIGLLRQG